VTINDSIINDNDTVGIVNFGVQEEFAQGSKVVVNNTTISENTSGIFNSGGNAIGSTGEILEVNNSSITASVPTEGDGIVIGGGNAEGATGGTLVVKNSTISNNPGTGILALGGHFAGSTGPITQISSSSLSGNKFALIIFPVPGELNASPVVEVKNSILVNSTSSNCFLKGQMLTSLGVNISTDDSCPGFVAVTPQELDLGVLQNNGGPIDINALIPPSAAINIVTDCTFINGDPVIVDQTGFLRPEFNCDAGAYEFEARPFVLNIPALSEWGILLTVILFGIAAAFFYNRNRKRA